MSASQIQFKNIKNSTDDLIHQLEHFSTILTNMSKIKSESVGKKIDDKEKIAGKKGTWQDTSTQNWISSLRK